MFEQLVPKLAALALVPALGAQAPAVPAPAAPPRPFSLDDVLRVRDVREPQISPDGAWVAYTVSTPDTAEDRKSTRLNSSHGYISYAVFCLKKKKKKERVQQWI